MFPLKLIPNDFRQTLHATGFERHPPLIVIDGKEIRWDEFGRMLMTYEGFHLKLEIFDRSEEMP